MDNFSATTRGVYLPSGGATTMTTAQTTVMKKTVVSVEISGEINGKTRSSDCDERRDDECVVLSR